MHVVCDSVGIRVFSWRLDRLIDLLLTPKRVISEGLMGLSVGSANAWKPSRLLLGKVSKGVEQ